MDIFVPGYRMVDQIGEGGMGMVFQARDLEQGRLVALKVLPRHLHVDPEARGRFLREAILASTLDHPNICRLLTSGETPSGEVYIAMEFCAGRTLEEWLRRRLPALGWALDVAIQTSRGLSAAHEKGIVHRDIKPSNLMLSRDGVVKILDFGLARFLPAAPIRQEGSFLGSLPYAAPEQLLGGPIDHRVDLWALGAVLYEMTTGYPPFRGDRRQAIEALRRGSFEPLRRHRPDAPVELGRIVSRALRQQPRSRYPSADALRVDLESCARALSN
jgi:serine/threonine-protein kinase